MELDLRKLLKSDQDFLWEMLYYSIYVPDGSPPPEKNILTDPSISKYAKNWGKENDYGYIAFTENGKSVGAVWIRLFENKNKGYGYINDYTPELGIAVLPEYRGRGAGSILLKEIINFAKNKFKSLSLSVTLGNPAINLYKRFGFIEHGIVDDSMVMKLDLEK